MEAAGLGIGIVGLAVAFDSCLSFYGRIEEARDYPSDCEMLRIMYAIEREKLVNLRDDLDFLKSCRKTLEDQIPHSPGERIEDFPAQIGQIISRQYKTSTQIQARCQFVHDRLKDLVKLSESLAADLSAKHGISSTDPSESRASQSSASSSTTELDSSLTADILPTPDERKASKTLNKYSRRKAIAWIIKDRRRFERVINCFRYCNEQLQILIADQRQTFLDFKVLISSMSTMDMGDLKRISMLCDSQYTQLSAMAGIKQRLLANSPSPEHNDPEPGQRHWEIPVDDIKVLDADAPNLHFGEWKGKVVVIDVRDPFEVIGDDITPSDRLEFLVKMLRRVWAELSGTQSPDAIHVLECVGWFCRGPDLPVGLVYAYPSNDYGREFTLVRRDDDLNRPTELRPRPHINLHALLNWESTNQLAHLPGLGQRFELARRLGSMIARFHAMGWAHRNLTSTNILFLRTDFPFDLKQIEVGKKLPIPYITGFTYARPTIDLPNEPSRYPTCNTKVSVRSRPGPVGTVIINTQHCTFQEWPLAGQDRSSTKDRRRETFLPQYQYDPPRMDDLRATYHRKTAGSTDVERLLPFLAGLDFYAYGILLLEIAHWSESSWRAIHPKDLDLFLENTGLKESLDLLPSRVGEVYSEVVKTCLREYKNWETNTVQDVMDTWVQVLSELEKCRA